MRDLLPLAVSLEAIVGHRHVLLSPRATLRYRAGYRSMAGNALAVVRPGSLVELWRTIKACVEADVVVLVQAANTGLTGGSTPDGRIKRSVVIVSTTRLSRMHLIEEGRQVICLPGTSLYQLERALRLIGREPHSVIGSSCFGASVVGGVCNNSGGALVRRGPAYTELSLFAAIDDAGSLKLVNHLGFDLGSDPEIMLRRLEDGQFSATPTTASASDRDYQRHVRVIDAATPARFNADKRRLHDAAGSAGRIVVFAVRLDTFAKDAEGATFYIGTNDPAELTRLRRSMLAGPGELPIAAEYLHSETFDIADHFGRDTFYAIRLLGTDRLPALYAMKAALDGLGNAIGMADLSDRLLHRIGRLLPSPLPPRLRAWRNRFAHHLILKVGSDGLESTRNMLSTAFPSASGDVFECTPDEGEKAFLHRFVAAGAAVRYRAIERRKVEDIVALDVALPRNAWHWFGDLPAELEGQVVATLRYGHFFCHVFHRDYIIRKGGSPAAIKQRLLLALEDDGCEYPAEHNVGRQYRAKPALARFYRKLDPTNRFNPGIGLTPTGPNWTDDCQRGRTE